MKNRSPSLPRKPALHDDLRFVIGALVAVAVLVAFILSIRICT